MLPFSPFFPSGNQTSQSRMFKGSWIHRGWGYCCACSGKHPLVHVLRSTNDWCFITKEPPIELALTWTWQSVRQKPYFYKDLKLNNYVCGYKDVERSLFSTKVSKGYISWIPISTSLVVFYHWGKTRAASHSMGNCCVFSMYHQSAVSRFSKLVLEIGPETKDISCGMTRLPPILVCWDSIPQNYRKHLHLEVWSSESRLM